MVRRDETDGLNNILVGDNLWVVGGIPIRNVITSGDVMHSWTLPSLSLKRDAIPGRLNQMNLFFEKAGETFFGQCSELCGVNHRFMPIVVKTV